MNSTFLTHDHLVAFRLVRGCLRFIALDAAIPGDLKIRGTRREFLAVQIGCGLRLGILERLRSLLMQ